MYSAGIYVKHPFFRLLPLMTLCFFWGAPLSGWAEDNVNPGINDHYRGATLKQWQATFERQGREVWDRRQDIVAHLALKEGQSVADIGAGTGFFSILMAQQVGPSGKVYAVDITPDFVEGTVARAKQAGLNNVVGIVNRHVSADLPVASVDAVFISDTYHHFEYPQSMLNSLYSALRPEGELVIVDFKKNRFASSWVMRHVRGDAREVIREVEAAGFKLVEEKDMMATQYFLRFQKR